jgi:carbon starvation protein
MSLLVVVLVSAAFLLLAYRWYGSLLARLLRLDPDVATPAVALRDDVDYVPAEPKYLLGQHFSAIAAAGPIVGPILAGVMFGWAPALLWILLGSAFIGGVHDITALVASVRHRARSIAEVVRDHMTPRSYVLFLSFVWIALVYIIVAFTDITASSFVGVQTLEDGRRVAGAAVATSSLLYLALPIAMGLLLRFARLPLGWATAIFLPLVGVAIWVGPAIPFDLGATIGLEPADAHKLWDVLLLAYCFAASVTPMWILLQPRGHLGGYFLFFALAGGALGLVLGGGSVQYPAFVAWTTPKGDTLFPILFITIACGACSGFHAIIASGTSSKQLRRETDAKVIGYGAMLLEGMVAVVSLCCVMMLAADAALVKNPQPNFIYAQGIGSFLQVLGIPAAFGISFGLMAFTTFVYDTLDVCTRLGRYILQELTGWKGRAGRLLATAVTAGVPLFFVTRTAVDAGGRPIPAWKAFWSLFGASNQLLAALTLLGVTVWLLTTRKARWVWLVTGLPAAWMYVMSTWALLVAIRGGLVRAGRLTGDPVPWVALVLVGLAVLMLVEAIRVLAGFVPRPPQAPEAVPVPAGPGGGTT